VVVVGDAMPDEAVQNGGLAKSDIDFRSGWLPLMSVLYKIIYNGTPLVVNPIAFARFSPIFAQYYDPTHGGEMKITSEIPVSNFEEFLPAVQGAAA
jgi:hypothetical protein